MDNPPFVDTSNSQWIFHCHVWWHRRVNEQIAAMFHWDDWRQWLGDIPCEGLISMFSEVLWSAGLIFLDFDVLLRKTIRFQWILGHFYLNHHFPLISHGFPMVFLVQSLFSYGKMCHPSSWGRGRVFVMGGRGFEMMRDEILDSVEVGSMATRPGKHRKSYWKWPLK